jgi:protein ImuA
MADPALAKEALCALRQTIARIETGREHSQGLEDAPEQPRLRLGVQAFDEALEGGLPLGGVNELRAAATADSGAASGFALGLAALARKLKDDGQGSILWVSEGIATREAGHAHSAGLLNFGIKPHSIMHAMPRKLEDALWICETALNVSAFAAIILEIRGNPARFGLAESRRLHLRAQKAGLPLFLLRQAGEEEASSACNRLRVVSAPARNRKQRDGAAMPDTIGNPVFKVTIEKSRLPAPLAFFMEWNTNECQFYSAERRTTFAPQHQIPAHSGPFVSPSRHRSAGAQTLGAIMALERAS